MRRWTLLLSGLALSGCLSLPAAAEPLRIATGSPEGAYYPVGRAISIILAREEIAEVEVLETAGSVENLELLRSGQAELAIVQSDILSDEPQSDIRALGALFPEYAQIVVRADDPIFRPVDLVNKRVFPGDPGSGTRRNATDLLRGLSMERGDYVDVTPEIDSGTAISALLDHRADAVFWTDVELIVNRLSLADKVRMLTLSEADRRRLARRYGSSGVAFTSVTDMEGRTTSVMFSRAVLITRSTLDQSLLPDTEIPRLLDALAADLEVETYKVHGRYIPMFQGDRSVIGAPTTLHEAASEHYRMKGFLPDTHELLILTVALWLAIITVAFLRYGGIQGAVLAARDWMEGHLGKGWLAIRFVTASPMMLSLWMVVALLLSNLLMIIWFESDHSIQTNTRNPFANMSLLDLLTWIVSFAGAGVGLDVYPRSAQGKIFAALIPISGFVYAFVLVSYNFIQKLRRDDLRARGLTPVSLKDHVVICGWNHRVPTLLREITLPSRWREKRRAVVIAEHDDERPLAHFDLNPQRCRYVRGISSDYETLRRADIGKASCVVIVAGAKKVRDANRRSVLTAIATKQELERAGRSDSVPCVAELVYEENEEAFRHAGVDKIVNTRKVFIRLLLHALINPGVSELIRIILSFSSPPTALLQPVTARNLRRAALVGLTYDQALRALRHQGLLLLGIYRPPNDGFRHEASEMDFRKEGSPYLVNPASDEERRRPITKDDRVLLLANDGDQQTLRIGVDADLASSPSAWSFLSNHEYPLIVAPRDEYFSSAIVEVLAPRVGGLILVEPDADELGIEFTESVLRCSMLGHDYASISHLVEQGLATEHAEKFRRVTRALVLCPEIQAIDDSQRQIYHDDSTMALCMGLRDLYSAQFGKPLHIVAELRCDANEQLFKDIGVAQPVPTNTFVDLIISRMIFNRGQVTEFLLKCLSYRASNRLVRLEKWSVRSLPAQIRDQVVGKPFDEVLHTLRQIPTQSQLIAIVRDSEDSTIIINPDPDSTEAGISLSLDDSVFVLAGIG